MPELPEVETVVRTLHPLILGKQIKEVKVYINKIIKTSHSIDKFKELLINKEIKNLTRKGKHIIFDFGQLVLLSHLRMEGKYYFFNSLKNINVSFKHILFQIIFYDQSTLLYHDTRRFGTLHLYEKESYLDKKPLVNLGPEPWEKGCDKKYLYNKLKSKSIAIKSALLDQTIIAGLGNIYVNEVLFKSQINPLLPSKKLTLNQCEKIICNSILVMKKAIKLGGSSISSYTSSLGVDGKFQNHLMVHTRNNEPCFKCKTLIKKIKINGRGTYYCSRCQF